MWPTYQQLRPVLESEPPNRGLWERVSLELTRGQHDAEAARVDTALHALLPADANVVERMVRRGLRARDLDAARSAVATLPRDDPRAVALLAEIESASGAHDQAIRRIEEYLGAHDEDARLILALARYRERVGDREGARAAYDRLEPIVGRAGLPAMLVERGRFEERAGRHDVALQCFRRAAVLGGGRQALDGVARVSKRRGELLQTLEALRRLEAVEGDSAGRGVDTSEPRRRAERARLERTLGRPDE
jgi:tetratricopeptide (TPR) repeat protein